MRDKSKKTLLRTIAELSVVVATFSGIALVIKNEEKPQYRQEIDYHHYRKVSFEDLLRNPQDYDKINVEVELVLNSAVYRHKEQPRGYENVFPEGQPFFPVEVLAINSGTGHEAVQCFFNSYTTNKDFGKIKPVLEGNTVIVRGRAVDRLRRHFIMGEGGYPKVFINGHLLVVDGIEYKLADNPEWDLLEGS